MAARLLKTGVEEATRGRERRVPEVLADRSEAGAAAQACVPCEWWRNCGEMNCAKTALHAVRRTRARPHERLPAKSTSYPHTRG